MEMFNNGVPTKELFIFLKYNTVSNEGNEQALLSETDEILYKEFVSKLSTLTEQLKNSNNASRATASALFSMFGFNRHFCSMTGVPIIGKYYKIGGKIVSKEAYEAHKIIQEIDRKEEQIAKQNAYSMREKFNQGEE